MTAPHFALNSSILLFFYSTYCVGATEPASSIINTHFYSSGGIALVLVVMLFLISAWGFNKLTSRPPAQTTHKMHIVDGISLGMDEESSLGPAAIPSFFAVFSFVSDGVVAGFVAGVGP